MSNNNNFTTPINTSGALFVEDVGTQAGGINHFSGAYSIILPGITSLSDFDHVVFTCFGLGMLHWGNGTFGSPIIPCLATPSSLVEVVCGSYIAPSGQVLTTSGTVIDTISNAVGCDSIITISLTVNTVDATTIKLDSMVTAIATGASYQWLNCSMNTIIIGEVNQTYTITDSDSYAVIVTQGSCLDTSSCVNLCIPTTSSITEVVCSDYTAPSGQVFTVSGVYIDIISNATGCDSMIMINLTIDAVNVATTIVDSVVTAVATGAIYQWINCTTNTLVLGETNQSYAISNSDNYAVIVTQGSCSDTSSCVKVVVTGIEINSSALDINIYPNPTNNDATINLGTLTDVLVTVTDITGKTVYSIKNDERNQMSLNVASFKKGLYFVVIKSDKDQQVLKLIKQ
jgi:hypothetical protein